MAHLSLSIFGACVLTAVTFLTPLRSAPLQGGDNVPDFVHLPCSTYFDCEAGAVVCHSLTCTELGYTYCSVDLVSTPYGVAQNCTCNLPVPNADEKCCDLYVLPGDDGEVGSYAAIGGCYEFDEVYVVVYCDPLFVQPCKVVQHPNGDVRADCGTL